MGYYLFQIWSIGISIDDYVEEKVSLSTYPREETARHFVCYVINEAVDKWLALWSEF